MPYYMMTILFLLLALAWNEKDGAVARKGEQNENDFFRLLREFSHADWSSGMKIT